MNRREWCTVMAIVVAVLVMFGMVQLKANAIENNWDICVRADLSMYIGPYHGCNQ